LNPARYLSLAAGAFCLPVCRSRPARSPAAPQPCEIPDPGGMV
jgi:hypothetical protein